MSIKVNTESLSNDVIDTVNSDLIVRVPKGMLSTCIYLYNLQDDIVSIPYGYGVSKLGLERRSRDEFTQIKVPFKGELREEQVVIQKKALKFLNKTGSAIISAYPGFGKTICSVYLASLIGMKTLIIVNKLVLIKQWKESILKFCPSARVETVGSSGQLKDADFYIINAINVEKLKKNIFNDIGTCICDEVHMLMAEKLSKSLQYVHPRYLIGLSATPYRYDNLDILFDVYFGENKIIVKLFRKHTVYEVKTGFAPKLEKTENGKLNWNLVLNSQAECDDRNNLIVSVVHYFKDRNFLILTKRLHQGREIVKKLKALKEYVTSLVDDETDFNREARILVATIQKCGTGFDHAKMNTLILASDVEQYYIQALGRIFRAKDFVPWVFDFVDSNHVLQKHYETRKQVYIEAGGSVKSFFREFPSFKKLTL